MRYILEAVHDVVVDRIFLQLHGLCKKEVQSSFSETKGIAWLEFYLPEAGMFL